MFFLVVAMILGYLVVIFILFERGPNTGMIVTGGWVWRWKKKHRYAYNIIYIRELSE